MDPTLYRLLWYFAVYAFFGWCLEVVYAAVCTGRFVNRGFLNGPVCPVYGFGAVLIILCLSPLTDDLLFLFIGSVLLTSLLEFITGFILERFFGDKWWDYSNEAFNIMGYVCLKFSLAWGVACVLLLHVIHPLLKDLVSRFPLPAGTALLAAFLCLLTADTAVTCSAAIKMGRQLKAMNRMALRLRAASDRLGEFLAEGTIDTLSKLDEGKKEMAQRFEASRREFEELKEKYNALAKRSDFIQRRLLNAFPRIGTGRHRESINRIIQQWKTRKG